MSPEMLAGTGICAASWPVSCCSLSCRSGYGLQRQAPRLL